jgi:superoxide dismutase, Cu-Zn family
MKPLALALLLAGCATGSESVSSARADIRTADGRLVARASILPDGGSGARIRVAATNFRPGTYGIHVHEVGRCDPPGFESAGPHWNPTASQHGRLNPQGSHLGDFRNLIVDAGGSGRIELVFPRGILTGGDQPLLDDDGAAIVIHANRDDERTDPSGNSGARIACGVLTY